MGRQGEWAMHQLFGVDVLKRGGGQYGGGSSRALLSRMQCIPRTHAPHLGGRLPRNKAAALF